MKTRKMTPVPPERSGTLHVQQVPVEKLRPWAGNPRVMPATEAEKLARSLAEFGLVEPLVVRRSDQLVIGGHQRLEAAKSLGLKQVPVVYVDLTDAQAKSLNLALNRIQGEWDLPKLGELLEELRELPEIDVNLSGFDDKEINQLLADLERQSSLSLEEERFDVAEAMLQAEKSTAPAQVKPGELWSLGRHRLLCGDCTEAGSWQRLLDGKKAQAIITDPPYGVNYVGGRAAQEERLSKARRGIGQPSDIYWDEMTPAAYRELLTKSLSLAHSHSDAKAPLYLWFAIVHLHDVLHVLAESGWQERSLIIWAKNRGAGALFAQYKHWFEPCFYAYKKGKSPRWHGPTNEATLWEYDKPLRNDLHPTMKPLPLIERAIRNATSTKHLIVDPFLGSGTAIIAAERTGRICYGLDKEARYCDVILRRWEALTGEQAARVE